jgi:hypothetical protein
VNLLHIVCEFVKLFSQAIGQLIMHGQSLIIWQYRADPQPSNIQWFTKLLLGYLAIARGVHRIPNRVPVRLNKWHSPKTSI